MMALPKFGDLHLKRLEEIESNVRSFMVLQFEHNNFFRNELKQQKSFMTLQFEHNNFFRNELKEQKGFLGFMNKELEDMNK